MLKKVAGGLKRTFSFIRKPPTEADPIHAISDDVNKSSNGTPPFRSFRDRIEQIRTNHGPDAIVGIIDANVSNEAAFLFQKFMRTIIGTNNIITLSSPDWSIDPQSAIYAAVGQNSISPPIEFLQSADLVLSLHGSPSGHNHNYFEQIRTAKQTNQTSIITFDPLHSPLTAISDFHFPLGSEGESDILRYFLHMAHVFGATDREVIWRDNGGFQKLLKDIKTYQTDEIAAKWNLPPDVLMQTARLVSQRRRVAIIINSRSFPDGSITRVVKDAINLVLALGHVGMAGRGLFCLSPFKNAIGVSCMGSTSGFLPGMVSIQNESSREWFSQVWNSSIPLQSIHSMPELIKKIENRSIRALLCLGESTLDILPISDPSLSFLSQLDLFASAGIQLDSRCSFFWRIFPFQQTRGTRITPERLLTPVQMHQPESSTGDSGVYHDWEIVSLWIDSFLESPLNLNLEIIQNEMISSISNLIEMTPVLMESKARYMKPFTEECVEPIDGEFEIEDIQKLKFHSAPAFRPNSSDGGIPTTLIQRIDKRSDGPLLRIHPSDALKIKIEDGSICTVSSKTDSQSIRVQFDSSISPDNAIIEFTRASELANLTRNFEHDLCRIHIRMGLIT